MKLETIGRLLAIAMGIMSAVLLARDGFNIPLNEYLDAVIQTYDDTFKTIALTLFEPLIHAIFACLREYGWHLNLFEHWKYAFVLLWLFNASFSRGFATTPSGPEQTEYVFNFSLRWIWAALTALFGGVMAGTVPIGDPSVFWWPIAAFFAYRLGFDFLVNIHRGEFWSVSNTLSLTFATTFVYVASIHFDLSSSGGNPSPFWWPVTAYFAYVAFSQADAGYALSKSSLALVFMLVCQGIAQAGISVPWWLDFSQSSSPGLVSLTAFVTILSTWYLLFSFLWPDLKDGGFVERWLSSRLARIALDIFVVLGGAATTIYIGRMLA
jgi:hypothetical protein